MTQAAVAIETRCPACAGGAMSQRDTYVFARAYLCNTHRAQWDSMDEREHRTGCPFAPVFCRRCHGGKR